MIEVVPRKDIEIVSTAEMTGLVSMIGMIGTEIVSIVEIDRERDIGTSPETPTGISPETTIEMRLTIDTETVSIEIVLEIDIEIIRSMIGMLLLTDIETVSMTEADLRRGIEIHLEIGIEKILERR